MALKYNTAPVQAVKYNGADVDKIIYNGVTVFKALSPVPPDTMLWVDGVSFTEQELWEHIDNADTYGGYGAMTKDGCYIEYEYYDWRGSCEFMLYDAATTSGSAEHIKYGLDYGGIGSRLYVPGSLFATVTSLDCLSIMAELFVDNHPIASISGVEMSGNLCGDSTIVGLPPTRTLTVHRKPGSTATLSLVSNRNVVYVDDLT